MSLELIALSGLGLWAMAIAAWLRERRRETPCPRLKYREAGTSHPGGAGFLLAGPAVTLDPPRHICVYCGSKTGRDGRYEPAADALAAAILRRGYGLVYGGGGGGLMGRIADQILAGGGDVLGVIPRDLMARELGHRGVTELVVVDDMHQRKARMAAAAAAFVALPGGYGTLEEVFEAVAWAQLGIHDRRVGLLDADGYYGRLVEFLDHAVTEGFLHAEHRALLRVDADPEALLDALLPPV